MIETGPTLAQEIVRLIGNGAMQRYEVLKRYAAVAQDAVVETIDLLVGCGELNDDGVFLRVNR